MTIACASPDAGLGIALRLSLQLDCRARALGENGYQAMVGGPVQAGLLAALVTLFVALIGYRLLVGRQVVVGDAIGWAWRLGIVLALVTGWPAFQTLAYRVAMDGPAELAAVVLPAAGLPTEGVDARLQAAYDTIRLGGATAAGEGAGTSDLPAGAADRHASPAGQSPAVAGLGGGQMPRPATALLLVVSALGLTAAFRIAVGFLLAIAPLPIMALLFDATLGLFAGWVSALTGAALAVLATTLVAAIELIMVEGEIAAIQAYSRGMVAAAVDPQALPVVVAVFAVISLVAALIALRSAAAIRLRPRRWPISARDEAVAAPSARTTNATGTGVPHALAGALPTGSGAAPDRAALLSAGLLERVRHESAIEAERRATAPPGAGAGTAAGGGAAEPAVTGLGAAGRRLAPRRTRSAATRDRVR